MRISIVSDQAADCRCQRGELVGGEVNYRHAGDNPLTRSRNSPAAMAFSLSCQAYRADFFPGPAWACHPRKPDDGGRSAMPRES